MGRTEEVNEILNESINLCKKNKATFVIPTISLLSGFLILFLGIWAYIFLFQTKTSLIGLAVLVLLITTYLRTFFSAIHSWIIANTVWEEKAALSEGIKRAFSLSLDLVTYSLTALIVGLVSLSFRRKKNNILSKLVSKTFEGIPEDDWDTTTHLALPCMVIAKNDFVVALQEIKNSMVSIPAIKIRGLGLEYFTYPLFFITLIIAVLFGWIYYVSLGVLIFLSVLLVLFFVQSFIKTTYYTVLYIWIGEQINRKKKKKKPETRIPSLLENTITINNAN